MRLIVPAVIFLAVAARQMGIWALKKHRAYKKEFGNDYPRERKAMIPFLF
jgi:very-long-chain enoyl-CoA reductase